MDTHSRSSSQIRCWHHLNVPTSRIDCETNFLSIFENFFSKCLYLCLKAHFCHPFVTTPHQAGQNQAGLPTPSQNQKLSTPEAFRHIAL